MRYFLAALVALCACESDTTKLQRLQANEATACVGYDAVAGLPGGVASDTATTQPEPDTASINAQTRCELARRELRIFMAGK